MTTTVLISVAISAALTLLLLLLRGNRHAVSQEDAVGRAVEELTGRMDAMGHELSEALERTRDESRRTRILGELASAIDLEEVLSRTLGAAGALPNVDAAVVNVLGAADEPVTRAVGITPEDALEYSIGRPPSGRRIRSLVLDYGDQPERPGRKPVFRAGVAVPIPGEQGPLGVVTVFSHAPERPFDEDDLADIEALAHQAGRAIGNARRFGEARHQADIDDLTRLHTRRYLMETLAREIARAQRYTRQLALLVFDLDNFKSINDLPTGQLGGDRVLAEVAARVREVVRHSDIACRHGGDEFAVVLPESTLDDAKQLYDRIRAAVAARPIPPADAVRLSAGIAQVRPNDDAESFYDRAHKALRRAKEGGKAQVEPE